MLRQPIADKDAAVIEYYRVDTVDYPKDEPVRVSPQGAHRVLQVCPAVIDGRLRAGRLKVAA